MVILVLEILKKQKRNTKRPVEKYCQPKVAVSNRRERKMPNSNSSSSGENEMVVEISNNDQVSAPNQSNI